MKHKCQNFMNTIERQTEKYELTVECLINAVECINHDVNSGVYIFAAQISKYFMPCDGILCRLGVRFSVRFILFCSRKKKKLLINFPAGFFFVKRKKMLTQN